LVRVSLGNLVGWVGYGVEYGGSRMEVREGGGGKTYERAEWIGYTFSVTMNKFTKIVYSTVEFHRKRKVRVNPKKKIFFGNY
jgi:hypothetical protein